MSLKTARADRTPCADRARDVLGIGLGPFNLSVAALIAEVPGLDTHFIDGKPSFDWHPGLMFSDAMMQTSFLKDLVTFADPTNKYSFLSYLWTKGALHDFFNADFQRVPRIEFETYMKWVAERLPNVEFGSRAVDLRRKNGGFVTILDDGRELTSKHVVLGTGRRRRIPESTCAVLGARVFHASEYLSRIDSLPIGDIVLVGGGQTGAEIFLDLLRRPKDRFTSVGWYTRRSNLEPLDETHFTNEYFTPGYVRRFFSFSADVRRRTLESQKLSSDAITSETLRNIYQEVYRLRHFDTGGRAPTLSLSAELQSIERHGESLSVSFRSPVDGRVSTVRADAIVLATGFEATLPPLLSGLAPLIELEDGLPSLNFDYSVRWTDGRDDSRLYLVSGARHTHGIAEPNLSLMAWRSAQIINSIVGSTYFTNVANRSLTDWMSREPMLAATEETP